MSEPVFQQIREEIVKVQNGKVIEVADIPGEKSQESQQKKMKTGGKKN
ncbi:MAG: hypothetical protein NC911_09400 [Candidatus Omnitrophica bacterium]|nr:hypothetical protein [Candidatus Omnitrophota bacterium]